jgi:hypothetical protein
MLGLVRRRLMNSDPESRRLKNKKVDVRLRSSESESESYVRNQDARHLQAKRANAQPITRGSGGNTHNAKIFA